MALVSGRILNPEQGYAFRMGGFGFSRPLIPWGVLTWSSGLPALLACRHLQGD